METLEKQVLFWDIDIKKLDAKVNQDFVIERILQQGDFDDFNWALNFYGKEVLQEVFQKKMEKFNKKSCNFWSLYFNLEPSLCLVKRLNQKQSAFWTK